MRGLVIRACGLVAAALLAQAGVARARTGAEADVAYFELQAPPGASGFVVNSPTRSRSTTPARRWRASPTRPRSSDGS
ncbi:hypothetical protein V5P93_005022 [Actinokineospora auranticolor]|uniref:hypothetical protein n=1 Tax=Actinokineospora auranticolor TaxID=155976 RepID=UPI0015E4910C|nr:hypothetical protein [Actinokineospora auranticolor]